MSQWQALKDRAAGKWQLPVLLLSLILLPASLIRLNPPPTQMTLAEATERLDALASLNHHDQVVELGDQLLTRKLEEPLSEASLAPIHLQLARARYALGVQQQAAQPGFGRQVDEHYDFATAYRLPLLPDDFERWGRAQEWSGDFSGAIERFREALARGTNRPWELKRDILALAIDELGLPNARRIQLLDQFLADLGKDRLDLRHWAVERNLALLDHSNRLEEAATLLARNRHYFTESDLRERFHYFEAWLLHRTGRHEEAETHLRAMRNRLDPDDPVSGMTGWLLGRVILSDDGPQRPLEALSFFEDVIVRQASGRFGVAARLGRAEGLAMLERHDEALGEYHIVIKELERLRPGPPLDRDLLRTSLGLQADTQRQAGRPRESVQYAKLAVSLLNEDDVEQSTMFLQQLAQALSAWGAELDGQAADKHTLAIAPNEASSAKARVVFEDAAQVYQRLVRVNSLNERRSADASWRVAELYARAGRRARAAELYGTFAADRPQHPFAPRALLRIGQLHQASGRLEDAVDAYRECYRRFPRLLDSSRALVPLAQCYLALGPDYEELAEETLGIVLRDSEVFTPLAPEFSDALFLLGEALHRRGDFERAIATIEEALERYPDDPRGPRAAFLLADSFRRSGLALKAEVADARFAEEIQQMRADADARFGAAKQLFRRMINDYELRDPSAYRRVERVVLRLARLYEADCAFETQDYREALKLYEQTAGLYKHTPSALASYVQIINSHVFLGEPEEARAALARARVLVDAIPGEAFEQSVGPERREDWKRYFDWLENSELF